MMIATTGRGTATSYLVDTTTLRGIGNTPNPQAGPTTNGDKLTRRIVVGREPLKPTFSRYGKELWVAVPGEDCFAIIESNRLAAPIQGSSSDQTTPSHPAHEAVIARCND
jgi:hypothetical protein